MKTREEAHAALDRWMDEDIVGNLVFFRAPRSQLVDCVIEQTIKAREMDVRTRAAFENFFSCYGTAVRGEFHRDADGNPDRVKIVRGFDDRVK